MRTYFPIAYICNFQFQLQLQLSRGVSRCQCGVCESEACQDTGVEGEKTSYVPRYRCRRSVEACPGVDLGGTGAEAFSDHGVAGVDSLL